MRDDRDTYGGHMKAWEGFDAFRISGVELTRMGQQGIKGRYPIHWHLAGEVDPLTTYMLSTTPFITTSKGASLSMAHMV